MQVRYGIERVFKVLTGKDGRLLKRPKKIKQWQNLCAEFPNDLDDKTILESLKAKHPKWNVSGFLDIRFF